MSAQQQVVEKTVTLEVKGPLFSGAKNGGEHSAIQFCIGVIDLDYTVWIGS